MSSNIPYWFGTDTNGVPLPFRVPQPNDFSQPQSVPPHNIATTGSNVLRMDVDEQPAPQPQQERPRALTRVERKCADEETKKMDSRRDTILGNFGLDTDLSGTTDSNVRNQRLYTCAQKMAHEPGITDTIEKTVRSLPRTNPKKKGKKTPKKWTDLERHIRNDLSMRRNVIVRPLVNLGARAVVNTVPIQNPLLFEIAKIQRIIAYLGMRWEGPDQRNERHLVPKRAWEDPEFREYIDSIFDGHHLGDVRDLSIVVKKLQHLLDAKMIELDVILSGLSAPTQHVQPPAAQPQPMPSFVGNPDPSYGAGVYQPDVWNPPSCDVGGQWVYGADAGAERSVVTGDEVLSGFAEPSFLFES